MRRVKWDFSIQDVLCKIKISFDYYFEYFFYTSSFKIKTILFGIKLLGAVKCYGKIYLVRSPRSQIVIGNGVTLVSSTKRSTSSSLFSPIVLKTLSASAKIIIEDTVGLNGTSIVARSKTIIIGRGTMIAPNVTIMDSDFHALWPPEKRLITPNFDSDSSVIIGSNVWIGTRSIILKGVIIGDNSIIAAGSIVTKNVPPNTLVAGVPARPTRQLDKQVT
jgi:acetyltransferase-like isoleucine patch superfamily enzyme